MAQHKRALGSAVGLAILLALIAGGAAVYFSLDPFVHTGGTTLHQTNPVGQVEIQNGGITGLRVNPDFRIEGPDTTSFSVAPGGSVSGEVTLQILNPEPISVYLDDLGFNGTSTLPEGISVAVSSGGVQFTLERLTAVGAVTNDTGPLVPTAGLATASFTYVIYVGSTVPQGTYDVVLYFVSFHGGELFSGYTYTVVLNVR